LVQIPPEELPILTEEKAEEVIAYFETQVAEWDWKPITKGSKGFKNTNSDPLWNLKPRIDITSQKLQECLSYLDADDYDQWVKVGMALYHQYGTGYSGFDLWNEWSQKSDKYVAEGMQAKWDSFRAELSSTNPTTVASILYWTRDARQEKEDKDLLDTFLSRYVYLLEGDRVVDLDKPANSYNCKLMEFRNLTASKLVWIDDPNPDKPPKAVKASKLWLEDPERQTAHGTVYQPGSGRLLSEHGFQYLNTFHTPEFLETDSFYNIGVFQEHMEYLIPCEREREWFISWLAFNIQKPMVRCKVTPLHISRPHGTGRGWIVELLQKLLGAHNVTKTKAKNLCESPYNEYLDQSLVCAVEEIRQKDKKYALDDEIRDTLTENWLEVNRKYGGKGTQQVFTKFLIFSNHADPLVLGPEDRRVLVMSGPEAPKSNAYYTNLYKWLENGDGVSELYNWLKLRDLRKFEWQRAFMTPAKEALIAHSRNTTESLFWELMQAPSQPVMSYPQIKQAMYGLSEKDAFETEINEQQLQRLLQHNCTKYPDIKIDGTKVRPWVVDNKADVTKAEVRDMLKEN